ncbi:MAG: glycosyltransferase family A protein [Bacillus mycoides]
MFNQLKPIVSIIIPCYNYGDFLEEAIDSCLDSTFQDLEIIVVNDGSTDPDTITVLNKLNKKPKTCVIHQGNKGVSAARNLAIRKSKGKYFLPLDADDKIHPTLIEKGYKILETNSEIGFVTHWTQIFGTENSVLDFPSFDEKILLSQNIVINTSLTRKKAWHDVDGYDEKILGYEDWDFWISLVEKGWKGYTIPEILFYYRRHGKSKNFRDNENSMDHIKQIRDKHCELYRFYGIP